MAFGRRKDRQLAGQFHGDEIEQLQGIDRLEQKRRKLARREQANPVLDFVDRHAREQNHRESRAGFLQIGQDVKAVLAGHLQIEDQQVDGAMLEKLDGGFGVAAFVDFVALAAKEMGKGKAFDG